MLVLDGHGWGHGLGLSQWGAYGYAQHGWRYDRILAHYYPGTTPGRAKARAVRVLLVSAKKATLSSAVPWAVTDAAGRRARLDPESLVLKGALVLAGQPLLQPPYTFAAAQPLSVNGTPYRGKLVVAGDGKVVQVIDIVGLEQYLKGVVPAEMPSDWAPDALKAQAVAARSYALANLAQGRPFDLYGDTRDQAYGGVKAESASTNDAVDATRGEVVLYARQGRRHVVLLHVGRAHGAPRSSRPATAVPYLVPVADPYDTLSPYHDWGPMVLDAAKVAKALKLSAPIADLQTTTGASGRVRSVTAVCRRRLAGDADRQPGSRPRSASAPPGSRRRARAPAGREDDDLRRRRLAHRCWCTASMRLSLESKTAAAPVWAPAGDLALGAGRRRSRRSSGRSRRRSTGSPGATFAPASPGSRSLRGSTRR